MKKVLLTFIVGLLISLSFAFTTTNHEENLQLANMPNIVSVTYTQDSYEKNITCVVMVEVNGEQYVGIASSITLSGACDAAYNEAMSQIE